MTIRYCALFKRKRTGKCFANRIQFRKRVSKNFFQTYRFLFFKRSEKTKSFQDLYAANVLTYQEKSDRSLLYQTVFDFQNITQVRTAKEDFIRLETDPLMYLLN